MAYNLHWANIQCLLICSVNTADCNTQKFLHSRHSLSQISCPMQVIKPHIINNTIPTNMTFMELRDNKGGNNIHQPRRVYTQFNL